MRYDKYRLWCEAVSAGALVATTVDYVLGHWVYYNNVQGRLIWLFMTVVCAIICVFFGGMFSAFLFVERMEKKRNKRQIENIDLDSQE